MLGQAAPIFPTHDEHLNTLARHKPELGGRFLYPFPGWDVLEPLQSKRYQLETAQRIGLATPATFHPRSLEETLAAADEVGFPVLVKPSDNVVFKRIHRRQAFFCTAAAELERAYRLTSDYEPMLQEFVPGGDEYLWTLGTYIAQDGEVLARFCGRKLRQTRENMGSARVGEALWDEEVVESGVELLRALGFHGVAQVEWKRDPRGGELKLIEVNPRLWQWHSLSGACGADVVGSAYRDLVGLRGAPARSDGNGKRWAISIMHGQGFELQRPPYVDPVFASTIRSRGSSTRRGSRLRRSAGSDPARGRAACRLGARDARGARGSPRRRPPLLAARLGAGRARRAPAGRRDR